MYFNTPRFFERLKFMDQADTFIWLLSYQFDFVIVSHGNYPNLQLKRKWIDRKLRFSINEAKMINQGSVDFIGVDFADHNDKSHIDMSDGCSNVTRGAGLDLNSASSSITRLESLTAITIILTMW